MSRAPRSNMPVMVMATAALLALTALVAAFIDGGDLPSRLLLILLHPVCVWGLLSLTPTPRLSRTTVFAIAGLQALTLAADLALAGLIAAGAAKGNWWIPAAFAAIPAAGIVYTLKLAGTLPESPSR